MTAHRPPLTAHLLRIGQLLAWTGLPERTLKEIVATGQLGGAPLWPGGQRYFLRSVCESVLFGAPCPSLPFGPEPEPELLRRHDVLAWTGLSDKRFRWAERHLPQLGRAWHPNGKRHYRKDLIRAHFFTPLLPTGSTVDGGRRTVGV